MASIAAVFLAAAIAVALRRAPWCDEAWFACAGFNLAAHGKLITPVIAPAPDDPKTLGLGLHTYWVMPLHLLFQAGWYKLFGFSLFALRVDPLGTGRAVVVVLDHAGVDRGNAYRSVDRRLAGDRLRLHHASRRRPHGHDERRAGLCRAGRLSGLGKSQPESGGVFRP